MPRYDKGQGKQLNGARGGEEVIRANKQALDEFYGGEALRHKAVGKSCADCDYMTCHPRCEGIYGKPVWGNKYKKIRGGDVLWKSVRTRT